MDNFDGRTVMITGASGNLGRAVAQAFAQRGARLVLLDRHTCPLRDLPGAAEARHMQLSTDLLDAEAVRGATQEALQEFGRIDVL
jgi:NAD(P)-dependent dehydrogenase (short-subunit alcohol dehydrogenase family)